MVREADPADKADLYAQLNLTLTYQPDQRLVEATVKPGFNMRKGFPFEGGLEPPFRCDFPGSGKSCNKSNRSGADAPGYSAKCSLFILLPGLCMAGAAGAGLLLLRRRLQSRDYRSSALRVLSSWAARAGPDYLP